MSDEEFEREEYGDLAKGQENSDAQATINEFKVSPYCGTSECTAKEEDPAEEAWLRLMTAVPVAGQTKNIRPARDIGSYALPKGLTVQQIVEKLRPSEPDNYALDTIMKAWQNFRKDFKDIPEDLNSGLKTLAEDWTGEDYDAFEEQVSTVIRNCQTIIKDIGETDSEGVIKILADKSESIYREQGGEECVYPAPKFFLEDRPACAHSIHIRPPFFKTCEVKADDETKVALEWAGFDSNIVDEVHEERERIYENYMEYCRNNPDYEEDGMKGEELARTRADEWADRQVDRLGTDGQEELQAEASRVNEEITDRQSNVDMAVSEISPDVEQSEQTTFNDGGDIDKPGSGGLDGGGGPGGAPDLGGMGGLDNTMDKPSDLSSLNNGGLDNSGLDNSGLDNSGLDNSGLDNGGLDDNPWDPSTPDPDDIGGGLAGGGSGLPGGGAGGGLPGGGAGGGLPGGGAGGGLGAGAGAGGGVGGMMGAGGMGRGGGAGAGAGGKGAGGMKGGAGRGGMGGMMGGGGRGVGGSGEDQDGKESWLTEDDDVWGIGNADEDPYA